MYLYIVRATTISNEVKLFYKRSFLPFFLSFLLSFTLHRLVVRGPAIQYRKFKRDLNRNMVFEERERVQKCKEKLLLSTTSWSFCLLRHHRPFSLTCLSPFPSRCGSKFKQTNYIIIYRSYSNMHRNVSYHCICVDFCIRLLCLNFSFLKFSWLSAQPIII